MEALFILTLAFAPGLFWLWYFFKKDKLEPEPLHRIRNCFFLGMAVVIPSAFVEVPFDRVHPHAALVIGAPIIEELAKFLVVRYTVFRSAEFDEPMDGVVYAAAVALGFASLENVFYLFAEYHRGAHSFALVTIFRAILTVPGHALWSSMWGYALGFAKFSDAKFRKKLIVEGLLLAMALHALFNFLCLTGTILPLGMLVLVPIMWRMTSRRIKSALEQSPHVHFAAERTAETAEGPPKGTAGARKDYRT
ncbi:MAG: PrsW family glutamic-type intramembrane protease [Desulfomonilaceae bacterium]|nr:PrsW family glutamic-type intramembrane protease [Desulfomonilaceae bacterium]